MAKSPGDKANGKRKTKLNMGAATDKLTELAQNPLARSMLAAGLVAAAAALTTNEKVRQNAKKAGREALDGAEAAADSASKIGAAIVTAATEAVRRIMVSGGAGKAAAPTAGAAAKGTGKAKTKARTARTATKAAAAPKAASKAPKRTAGAARKKAPVKAAAAAPAKASAPVKSGGRAKANGKGGARRGKAKAGA